MKTSALVAAAAMCATVTLSSVVCAQNSEHTGHAMSTGTTDEVKAKAVVHDVDAVKGMINVTHDPIPALNWPRMTMALPVTKKVDLSKIKSGDTVTITLKQGMDKTFRIVGVDKAN